MNEKPKETPVKWFGVSDEGIHVVEILPSEKTTEQPDFVIPVKDGQYQIYDGGDEISVSGPLEERCIELGRFFLEWYSKQLS